MKYKFDKIETITLEYPKEEFSICESSIDTITIEFKEEKRTESFRIFKELIPLKQPYFLFNSSTSPPVNKAY